MPSFAAAAAVARAWFDWTPPAVISVSAPSAFACAATNASLRTLLPPNPNGIASSLLISRRGPPPRRSDNRGIDSTIVGPGRNGSEGKRASVSRNSFDVTDCILDTSAARTVLVGLKSGLSPTSNGLALSNLWIYLRPCDRGRLWFRWSLGRPAGGRGR